MRYFIIFLFVSCIISAAHASDPPSIISIEAESLNVAKYCQFELNIELQTAVNQRYNYDSIVLSARFLAPDGTHYTVDGFYFQDYIPVGNGLLQTNGDPFWKIRFSPTQAGTWIYNVTISDAFGIDSIVNQSFSCFNGDNGGFVKQAPNKSFLINDEGQSVFLVGENIAWANAPDGSDQMTYYLQKLQAHEMNFAKLMMTPWCYQIEWEGGLRNYAPRQKQAFLMDSIFDLSNDYGIYLQIAFSIHNELSFGYPAEDWTSNPYNIANGGMCTDPKEFFSNPKAKSAFKNRLRYLLARWGYASNLIGWELLSEADNFPYYSQSSNQIANWSNEMASYLKQYDVNQHLVSVGFALPKNNPAVWNAADIGFTQMHLYNNVGDIEGDVFRQIGMYLKKYNKPVLIGEFGLGHIGDTLVKWDPD
ncbi:MAG: DUF5060 domain-containing protein, partial [Ignavibacteria bacterium]|nr:DUF5060 domain-containing protein [Ignavibacteria bacterium]